MKRELRIRWLLAALAITVVGCQRREPAPSYMPGLGEIMTLTQMRHAKLWLAAQNGNWSLADYEIDELEEGFEDAVKYHPTHKNSPVALADSIPALTSGPISALRTAAEAKDGAAFTQAFDALTQACNACHRATNFGFNVVTRPSGNTFTNQDFSVPPSEN